MNLMITFCICAFNIYSLLFIMSDIDRFTEILVGISNKAKIYSALFVLIVAVSVMWGPMYLIIWLFLEYIVVLSWYGKHKKNHLKNAVYGIISIIAMIVTELTIIFLYYHKGIENLEYTGKINCEIQIVCYLGMALIQQLFIICNEIRKSAASSRRKLITTLAVKAFGDIIWLYICISTLIFKNNFIITSVLFMVEIIINYYAFCIMILKMEERTKQEKRADIHANTYEYYLNMEEEHLQIRKMYHEMKNQLMIMEESGKTLEGVPNSRMIREKLEKVNQFYHTGNPSLDILLFDGRMKARSKDLEFDAVVSEGCLNFMDGEDINIIFSNAIINAIEACEKIKDGPKQIKIKAGKNLNDTLIYIKNTVSKEREKGSLNTRKKNKIMHGIGLTSIQECVEKYGGYVSIIEESGTFQLAILFGKE